MRSLFEYRTVHVVSYYDCVILDINTANATTAVTSATSPRENPVAPDIPDIDIDTTDANANVPTILNTLMLRLCYFRY
ncbi:MAG: hypothetical protein HRU26_14905 [Psychroserpens sp.]|nr:hypothetical protein [Psychroserpens sp.]